MGIEITAWYSRIDFKDHDAGKHFTITIESGEDGEDPAIGIPQMSLPITGVDGLIEAIKTVREIRLTMQETP